MDRKRKSKPEGQEQAPAGEQLDVALGAARTGGATSAPDNLHVCFHCSGELVYPLDWSEEGPRHWRVVLRCPDCESRREGVFEQAIVERLDDELDRGAGALLADLRRCELKTAALFEAACRLGALSALSGSRGRANRVALADALGTFARRIGLAFQMLDDVLDVSGPPERTGKPRGTDLLDGTVTLPFIFAREREPDLCSVDLRSLRGASQVEALCDRIAATGALEQARDHALAIVVEAKAALPGALANGGATVMGLLADSVVERYR